MVRVVLDYTDVAANSSPPRDLAIQVLDAFVNNTQFRQAVWKQGEAISGFVHRA